MSIINIDNLFNKINFNNLNLNKNNFSNEDFLKLSIESDELTVELFTLETFYYFHNKNQSLKFICNELKSINPDISNKLENLINFSMEDFRSAISNLFEKFASFIRKVIDFIKKIIDKFLSLFSSKTNDKFVGKEKEVKEKLEKSKNKDNNDNKDNDVNKNNNDNKDNDVNDYKPKNIVKMKFLSKEIIKDRSNIYSSGTLGIEELFKFIKKANYKDRIEFVNKKLNEIAHHGDLNKATLEVINENVEKLNFSKDTRSFMNDHLKVDLVDSHEKSIKNIINLAFYKSPNPNVKEVDVTSFIELINSRIFSTNTANITKGLKNMINSNILIPMENMKKILKNFKTIELSNHPKSDVSASRNEKFARDLQRNKIGIGQDRIMKIFVKLSKELKYIQDLLFQYLKESGYIISNIYKIYDSVLKPSN